MAMSIATQPGCPIESFPLAYKSLLAGAGATAGGIYPAPVKGYELARSDIPSLTPACVVFADATDVIIRWGDLLETSTFCGHLAGAKPDTIPLRIPVGKSLHNVDPGHTFIRLILGARP